MSDDIVARLRQLDADLVEDEGVVPFDCVDEAIDEIERLRAERDGYLEGNRQTLAALAEANEIAKKYKAERDEARRRVCEDAIRNGRVYRRVGRNTVRCEASKEVAEMMGWDCFREQL